MTNKNFTAFYSLFLFSMIILTSCSDDSSNTGPLNITGEWDSDGYSYYPNCDSEGMSFDDYISYLILVTQEASAQQHVDMACDWYSENTDLGEGWCDTAPTETSYETRADSIFAEQLEYLIYQWNTDSTYLNNLIAENTHITEMTDISLNINPDNTYKLSYEGTCTDYNELTEDDCIFLEDVAQWNGESCEILTETGCALSFVSGIWDEESFGVLEENGDNYIMVGAPSGNLYDGLELIFDGSAISITVISEDDLCIRLMFGK